MKTTNLPNSHFLHSNIADFKHIFSNLFSFFFGGGAISGRVSNKKITIFRERLNLCYVVNEPKISLLNQYW